MTNTFPNLRSTALFPSIVLHWKKAISEGDQVLLETRSRRTKLVDQRTQEAPNEILNENYDLRKAMEADPNRDPKR